ncbi:MAG: hypothetical protein ACLRRH_06850 [Clostridium sp.]
MKKRFFDMVAFIILCTVMLCGCINKQVEMTEESKTYLAAVEEMVSFYEKNPYIFYNCKDKKEWTTTLENLKKDIKNNKVSESDIYYRMSSLSAVLNNSHTQLVNLEDKSEKVLPIKGNFYGDNFYIVFTNFENRELLGSEIIAINNINFEEIEERYSKIISAENNQWVRSTISNSIFTESLLKYLDIWKDDNIFTVKTLEGKTEDVIIDSISTEELYSIMPDLNNYFGYESMKESIENNKPEDAYDQYWFTLDEDNRILYFQYNTCLDKNDKSAVSIKQDVSNYPDFKDFREEFTQFANSNKDYFDKIVVDVSNNRGGVPSHIDNLISENIDLFNSKKVYAIMTKNTYSAGVCAVNTLVDKCNATMVGEETGGSIEVFAVSERRVSSILPYEYSSGNKKIDLLDKAGKNTKDYMRGAIPDIEVEATIEDNINGINPYYQAVIDN